MCVSFLCFLFTRQENARLLPLQCIMDWTVELTVLGKTNECRPAFNQLAAKWKSHDKVLLL